MMAGMLATMCDRGPDSAGFAVYGAGDSGHVKLTVRAMSPNFDFASLAGRLSEVVGSPVAVDVRESHGIFTVPEDAEQTARKTIEAIGDDVRIVGSGTRIELFKGVGITDTVADRLELAHCGHARHRPHAHGDEVAVTIAGSHPFSTGGDQCLVHNGSLSNHNALRGTEARRLSVQTENDSEVAAAYLTWRMREGDTLWTHWKRRSTISTASTPSWWAPATASRCCAIRSPASRP